MIPCKHCNTPNSLDSTFCKRCGAGLPEDEVVTAKAKLEKVVEEGIHALNLGKLEEAMAVAEMAVASDPSMASAFALKASTHERKGQIAEALECAERLVELNPDSELDKIKRNQLRAALGAIAMQNRPPSRMVAGVAAISVAAIVLCSAVLTAKYVSRPAERRVVVNNPVQRELVSPQTVAAQNSGSDVQSSQTAPQNQTAESSNQAVAPNEAKSNGLGPDDVGPATDQGDSPTLPPPQRKNSGDPGALPETNNLQLTPLNPHVPSNLQQNDQSANPPRTVKDNSQDPGPQPEPVNPKSAVQTPPPDPGEIDIRIHDNGSSPRVKPGSSQENPKDTSKIFMKMGNDYYQMGNFSGAASSLERARSSGADPASSNYRLAQSYNSLGKKSDAIDAYKRAISACSESLNSGKGNSAKLRAMRDASETALRQLQGG